MFQETAVIRRLRLFRPTLFEVELECRRVASAARPGQFVHLLVRNVPGVLLRRPYSVAGVEGDRIRLIVKIVGRGSQAFSQCRVGDFCDLIGPLGSGFQPPERGGAFLIGGGIGVAPLLFLQKELQNQGIPVTFFLGGRSQAEFPLEDEEIRSRGIIACTDDGSYGEPGFVSAIFEKYLLKHNRPIGEAYSCGPTAMMKEIVRLCREHHLLHRVSLESRMACAVGVCQGCAVRTSSLGNQEGNYRLVCKDGPVFDADLIEWDSIC